MTTNERIDQDLVKEAKARNAEAVSTLRMLRAALKNRSIEKGGELSEEDVVAVVGGEAKKLRDSLTSFKDGGRDDLVEKTEKELALIERYLPAQLSDEELKTLVDAKKAELGAASPKDFGRLMGEVMKEAKGRADGGRVGAMVKDALSQAGS